MTSSLLQLTLFLTFVAIGSCTLYGLTSPQQTSLLRIDPGTFENTVIGKSLDNFWQAPSLAVVDTTNHIYYFLGENITLRISQVIGISTKDGRAVFKYDLPFVETNVVGDGQYIALDPNNGQIIVIGRTDAVGTHQILRIDPVSKTHKIIGTFVLQDFVAGSATYDGANNVIVLACYNSSNSYNIQGYNAYTGKLEFAIENTVSAETFVWDHKTGLVYGFGLFIKNITYGSRSVISVDVKNKLITTLFMLDDYFSIFASSSTFDPTNRILYSFLAKRKSDVFDLVGVNVDTGVVVSAPSAGKNKQCPYSIEWDN